jgi:23S rRNA pseudouridine1911/1915/1917 synthase
MDRAENPASLAGQARIIAETADFAVVWKPPLVHCVPLRPGEGGTLLEWYAAVFPPVMEVRGKKPVEGGMVHRVDYETQGLVLFAKNQAALDCLMKQQEAGRFIKEYGAITCAETAASLPGFPNPPPAGERGPGAGIIQSYFRAYGPGRKAVRPVPEAGSPAAAFPRGTASDRGRPYVTEVLETAELGRRRYFALRIKRGFRHQIRCHLAWTGNPILGDRLYGAGEENPADGAGAPGIPLALRSQGLFFSDPRDDLPREYRIPAIRDCAEYQP